MGGSVGLHIRGCSLCDRHEGHCVSTNGQGFEGRDVMGDIVCELSSIGKSYRKIDVIRGLSLKVEQGTIVSLSGPSGCGKTTLLNIVGLLEAPNTGTLKLFGREAPRPGSRGARLELRDRLGYLFQNFALIDNASVATNLGIAQAYARGSRQEKSLERERALERVGLQIDPRRPIYELSGGEQQRVSVARLLLKPCQLILADEPTGSLDASNRDQILALLRVMVDAGKTVVIVTHDPAVADFSDLNVHLV
jgi:putative ABC transport system ATP-binding protein